MLLITSFFYFFFFFNFPRVISSSLDPSSHFIFDSLPFYKSILSFKETTTGVSITETPSRVYGTIWKNEHPDGMWITGVMLRMDGLWMGSAIAVLKVRLTLQFNL